MDRNKDPGPFNWPPTRDEYETPLPPSDPPSPLWDKPFERHYRKDHLSVIWITLVGGLMFGVLGTLAFQDFNRPYGATDKIPDGLIIPYQSSGWTLNLGCKAKSIQPVQIGTHTRLYVRCEEDPSGIVHVIDGDK